MSRRRAFSLIELLVVISIITVLLALLLPAYMAAMERAHHTRWLGLSHGLRIDPDLVAYYNFEQARDTLSIPNQAVGDPLASGAPEPRWPQAAPRQAMFRYDQAPRVILAKRMFVPEDLDLVFGDGATAATFPVWTSGRWPSKGAVQLNAVASSQSPYLQAKKSDLIDLGTRDFTILTWFRVRPWGNGNLVEKVSTTWSGLTIAFYEAELIVNLTDARGYWNGVIWYGHPTRINDGLWHQLAVVRTTVGSGTEVRVYLDGELGGVEVDPDSIINLDNNGPLRIGNFDGALDEFGIWKRALRPDEIAMLYERGKPR